ncbi:MAG: 2,4-dienoyl-CoA reductase-like NADH-dependent reductase (Old Yellow Enzyme family) [Chitinophagales bacterium]|jgi:2,4-dienoyl-CoA reductase-like NADH-dependent reductase (Old Yellow Enzyme family)
MQISQPFTLPCGAVLPNRICKAAMTEGLADADDNPTPELNTLYKTWSEGGAGLLFSGNIMVDRRYLERGGNMVLEDDKKLSLFTELAAAGTTAGNQFWVQLNHPGRQCSRMVNGKPLAPSAVQLNLGGNFGQPKEMTEEDINDVISRFATSAELVKRAGFTGVQVHSAHGYLSSQFLSPLTNLRQDRWGGSLENRARFLLETVRAVRQAVGSEFPISVKLNSADFQQGGFELEDCQQVATWLCDEGIDLLEVSGGTYESLEWMDNDEKRDTTVNREAFFLKYAKSIRAATKTPLMISGGFRHLATMEDALSSKALDVVGIGRPFCVNPEFPIKFFDGTAVTAPQGERGLVLGKGWLGPRSPVKLIRAINNQGQVGWFYQQIINIANNKPLLLSKSVFSSFIKLISREFRLNKRRTLKVK